MFMRMCLAIEFHFHIFHGRGTIQSVSQLEAMLQGEQTSRKHKMQS